MKRYFLEINGRYYLIRVDDAKGEAVLFVPTHDFPLPYGEPTEYTAVRRGSTWRADYYCPRLNCKVTSTSSDPAVLLGGIVAEQTARPTDTFNQPPRKEGIHEGQ